MKKYWYFFQRKQTNYYYNGEALTQLLRKFGTCDYRILMEGKIKTFHANLLKKYQERGEAFNVHSVFGVVETAVIDSQFVEGPDDDVNDIITLPHPSQLSPSSVKLAPELTRDQRNEVLLLLEEFSDVLTDIPGCTNMISHDIKTSTTDPVRQKPYPIPFSMTEVIKGEIENMQKLNVIEPSDSPYCSPIVIVKKKDQTNRVCLDFRALNRITVFDAEPIPNVEDIFAKLAGNVFFSGFDLTKGYWQVPLTDDAKVKTAFQTPKGLMQFRVMPFGLVNAGATFSRLMRKLLEGMKNLDNFIDDVIVFTRTWELHMSVLRELFVRLKNARLTVKSSKCCIGFSKIDCLGHVASGCRLEPHADKLEAIVRAPPPETKRQVRSFLGLIGFYRKFVPNFSAIASPLSDLTKKGQPNKVVWGECQECSFRSLKRALTTSPILKLPEIGKPFIVQTDASDTGIGAVLLQLEDDVKFPVVYISRKLKPSESKLFCYREGMFSYSMGNSEII